MNMCKYLKLSHTQGSLQDLKKMRLIDYTIGMSAIGARAAGVIISALSICYKRES
jgi:hypothetical protein